MALSLLEILHFELCICKYLSLCVAKWWIFPKPVTYDAAQSHKYIIDEIELPLSNFLCQMSNHHVTYFISANIRKLSVH